MPTNPHKQKTLGSLRVKRPVTSQLMVALLSKESNVIGKKPRKSKATIHNANDSISQVYKIRKIKKKHVKEPDGTVLNSFQM